MKKKTVVVFSVFDVQYCYGGDVRLQEYVLAEDALKANEHLRIMLMGHPVTNIKSVGVMPVNLCIARKVKSDGLPQLIHCFGVDRQYKIKYWAGLPLDTVYPSKKVRGDKK